MNDLPREDKIRRAFARGLESYRENASVQQHAARRLADLLAQAGAPKRFGRLYEFGCGAGLLTQALAARFEADLWILNDLAPQSARHAGPELEKIGAHWRFAAGDAATSPPQELDLITAGSTIQWIEDLPGALGRWAGALRPGGWLALSGFAPAQFQELQALGFSSGRMSYLSAEELVNMAPPALEVMGVEQERLQIHFSSARAVLKHLRDTGVNGAAGRRWTRAKLKAFETAYHGRFSDAKGGVGLTYAPTYLIARKKL